MPEVMTNAVEHLKAGAVCGSGPHVRVCVLGASFDTPNMGVSALAVGTVKCVLQRWPNAELFLLDYGKEERVFQVRLPDRQVEIRRVNMRFSKKLYQRNHILRLLLAALIARLVPSTREKLVNRNPWLKEVADATVVAAMSGGDSFSDIYGLQRLAYVSLPQILVLILGKELVVLPQTLGPFKGSIAKKVARFILGHAELVYSRDQSGLRQTVTDLSLNDQNSKFLFNYDVGFALDPRSPEKVDIAGLDASRCKGRLRIGLNVSGLLWMGGYNGKNMFGLRADYRKMIYKMIESLAKNPDIEILLIPHVFGEGGESDSTVCAELYKELSSLYADRLGLIRGQYDQSEIKYVIGTCDFFVGSRMHACIAALSQCIPAVAIAYSGKFIGVLETIDMKDAVADPRCLDESEIVAFVQRYLNERSSIRQRLERKIPQVKRDVLGLFARAVL